MRRHMMLKYRFALGLDWIVALGEQDKGIGSGSDQLSLFAGIAMGTGGTILMVWLVSVLIGPMIGVLARGYDLITDTFLGDITCFTIILSRC